MVQLKFPIAAITDEFSPDLETALAPMSEIGMEGVELRVVGGKNILDLTDDELKRAQDSVDARGMKVVSIASPLLKCVLPGGPEIDSRFQHDVFASKHTYEDQPRLAARAFEIAQFFDAPVVRVFSFWRTTDPAQCFEAVAGALERLSLDAAGLGLTIGLENEHACNIATATEASRMLARVRYPNLKLVWDPANALVAGEDPFPAGYELLPKHRIAHVHAKDCRMDGLTPVWGPLGTRAIDWKGQISALERDGYHGWLSLETHWPGPGGDKFEASRICGWNLRGLSART